MCGLSKGLCGPLHACCERAWISPCLGHVVQGIWSRALGLPIERPKSVTMDVLEKKFA